MSGARKMQTHLCETLACLLIARDAAWGVAGESTRTAAGSGALSVTCHLVGHISSIATRKLLWNVAEKVANKATNDVIREVVAQTLLNRKAIAIETARATFRYVIGREEKIYSKISAAISAATPAGTEAREMSETIDLEKLIETVTLLDIPSFQEMNLGGQCCILFLGFGTYFPPRRRITRKNFSHSLIAREKLVILYAG